MSAAMAGQAWRDEVRSLIEEVTVCFHEPHRRELAELRPLFDEFGGDPCCAVLVSQMRRFGEALELHMFMEEMRLFPMMEQGGHVLIRHLIEDMEAEHVLHGSTAQRLRVLTSDPDVMRKAPALVARVNHLLDELDAHVDLEDRVLFARFSGGAA